MKNNVEIAIVGGGLAGLCAALTLQHPDRRVHLIESSDLPQQKSTGLNSRSIALSGSSAQIFRSLGLWSEIRKQAAPIRTIHISSQGRWGVTRLHASDYELDALGYVIESSILGKLLLDRVNNSQLITLDSGAQFENAEYGETVHLDYLYRNKKKQLNANLVLVADGASSKARASLGIEHRVIDYGQAAVITNLQVSKPVAGAAYERFTTEGPLAMLPLGRNRYACVWTHNPDNTDHLMQLGDEQFAEVLQQSFGYRLGFIEQVGQRSSFSLHRTEALTLAKNRCVLIGSAASALHQVAGQSFNLALRDLASLY
ncbi:MAG: FAD-dependent oxidoreductase, partial [Gammaproteobacteria bacterium]